MSSYRAADKGRRMLKTSTPGLGSPNADELPDIPRLRELSRDACRNHPSAVAAVDTMVSKVIGRGVTPQSQIDAEYLGLSKEEAQAFQRQAERLWKLWAHDSSHRCDAQRRMSFDTLAALALRSERENGDSFLQWVRRPRQAWPFTLQAQLIEADRVCNPNYLMDGGTPPLPGNQSAEVWGGVEQTRSGMPIAYWVKSTHPGQWQTHGWTWSRIPAKNTMGEPIFSHLGDLRRIGSTRAVPWLAPVLEVLKLVSEYSESEATAALVSSFFTVFVTSQSAGGLAELIETDGNATDSADGELELGPGLINDLAPGEEIETASTDRPNSGYGDFVKAQLRLVGSALGIPIEVLNKSFEGSYSSARAALLEAWEAFMQRRDIVVGTIYRPAWEMLLTEAAATGLLEVSPEFWTDPMTRAAYLEAQWVGPSMSQLDETKQVKAAGERIRIGISDRTTEARKVGGDYEKIVARLAQEKGMREALGLGEVELEPAPPEVPPMEDEETEGES